MTVDVDLTEALSECSDELLGKTDMHTKAQLKSYEDLEFAITLNAPVQDWRAMLKRLETLESNGCYTWPVSGFVGCIRSMLENLDQTHSKYVLKEDQAKSETAAAQ